ncbi:unnamed protein product [Timema podura]|uniref:SLC41A/MgtE integral membrane domain-containing protein n=1 Tax=Timema podura TaxID=61482 RepID=A0ABN7NRC6_TIMPD|nr:unnamed protein product [Timema podura]
MSGHTSSYHYHHMKMRIQTCLQAHRGKFQHCYRKNYSKCQAIVVGLMSAVVAVIMVGISRQEFDLSHTLLLCSCSVITSSIASLILGALTVNLQSYDKLTGPGKSGLSLSCSRDGPWTVSSCSLNNPRMVGSCSLNNPGTVGSCSLNNPGTVGSCSLNNPGTVGSCSLEGPEMVSSCPLKGPGMVSSGSLEGLGTVSSCSLEGSCPTALTVVKVLGLITATVIVLSHWFHINPDNVATPIAASLGDITSLALLSWVATLLYENTIDISLQKHVW